MRTRRILGGMLLTSLVLAVAGPAGAEALAAFEEAAAGVAGGAVLTWGLTRPPAPHDGGTLDWVANEPTAVEW
jgi:hypothetical protein